MSLRSARAGKAPTCLTFLSLGVETDVEGFVSAEHGFLPRSAPLDALPDRFAALDALAADLPALSAAPAQLADRLQALAPTLSAEAVADLADGDLWRAALVLGSVERLAAFHGHFLQQPVEVPQSVLDAWAQVCTRLGRPRPALLFHDLFVYNYREGGQELLVPVFGSTTERVWGLLVVELLREARPLLQHMLDAQTAVLGRSRDGVKAALHATRSTLEALSQTLRRRLRFGDGEDCIDPVAWANTCLPFAASHDASVPDVAWTSFPVVYLLDIALGRKAYASAAGKEAQTLLAWQPRKVQRYLLSVGARNTDIRTYCQRSKDDELIAAFNGVLAALTRFLDVHTERMYLLHRLAFLPVSRLVLAPQAERSPLESQQPTEWTPAPEMTRLLPWERVRAAADEARNERKPIVAGLPTLTVKALMPTSARDSRRRVAQVILDNAAGAVAAEPGDLLHVRVPNSHLSVSRTLTAMGVARDVPVVLGARWQAELQAVAGVGGAVHSLPLAELLQLAQLRPMDRQTVMALRTVFHGSTTLTEVLRRNECHHWELWSLLSLVLSREPHFSAAALVTVGPEAQHAPLCDVLRPAEPRQFLASGVTDGELQLTVARLAYANECADAITTDGADDTCAISGRAQHGVKRLYGAASSYLNPLVAKKAEGAASEVRAVRAFVDPERSLRFPSPPGDTPVVMFAEGVGIAPFRAFLCAGGSGTLFVQAKSKNSLHYKEDMQEWVNGGAVRQLHVAFTRDDVQVRHVGGAGASAAAAGRYQSLREAQRTGELRVVAGPAGCRGRLVDYLERQPEALTEAEGRVLICGDAIFCREVLQLLPPERRATASVECTGEMVPDEGEPLPVSAMVRSRQWIVSEGVAYDPSMLLQRGGSGLRQVLGTDATTWRHRHQARRWHARMGILPHRRLPLRWQSTAVAGIVAALHRAAFWAAEGENYVAALPARGSPHRDRCLRVAVRCYWEPLRDVISDVAAQLAVPCVLPHPPPPPPAAAAAAAASPVPSLDLAAALGAGLRAVVEAVAAALEDVESFVTQCATDIPVPAETAGAAADPAPSPNSSVSGSSLGRSSVDGEDETISGNGGVTAEQFGDEMLLHERVSRFLRGLRRRKAPRAAAPASSATDSTDSRAGSQADDAEAAAMMQALQEELEEGSTRLVPLVVAIAEAYFGSPVPSPAPAPAPAPAPSAAAPEPAEEKEQVEQVELKSDLANVAKMLYFPAADVE